MKKWCCSFKRANEHYDIVKRGNLMIDDGACLLVKNLPSKLANISASMLKFDHIQFISFKYTWHSKF